MTRKIVAVARKVSLHDTGNDFAYWQSQPYAVRIAALEEIRREYHAWEKSLGKDAADVQSRLQRVYRITKQK